MIVYRVQNAKGTGPFQGSVMGLVKLWEDGPTPREDGLEGSMADMHCGVGEPYYLPQWFPQPHSLRARGFTLTVWDVPDDHAEWLRHQAVFARDAATLIATLVLPDVWDEAFLSSLEELATKAYV